MYSVADIHAPQVLAQEDDFLVLYKPPRMHSAPLGESAECLLSWCAGHYPEVGRLGGRSPGEGGLIHRLDYETQGLLLVARTPGGMEALLSQQREGRFMKEYRALCGTMELGPETAALEGFPAPPEWAASGKIVSAFRAYGRGRRAVRPLPEGRELYKTEIIDRIDLDLSTFSYTLRLTRGFRHQVRCHLAWIGRPILNDPLYGGRNEGRGLLGLRATALEFTHPQGAQSLRYEIPGLNFVEV
ncbi:MAG: pseudouridine synthase [Treponema sp.]|nr:pseudouridine synthase [Treponema sp.]